MFRTSTKIWNSNEVFFSLIHFFIRDFLWKYFLKLKIERKNKNKFCLSNEFLLVKLFFLFFRKFGILRWVELLNLEVFLCKQKIIIVGFVVRFVIIMLRLNFIFSIEFSWNDIYLFFGYVKVQTKLFFFYIYRLLYKTFPWRR